MQEEARKKQERESASEQAPEEDSPMKDDEEDKEKENDKDKGQQPNSGNGGETDKYRWTQTLEELTVYIPLPDSVASKQLDVIMKP